MTATTTTPASAATVAANNVNPRTGESVTTSPKPAPKAPRATTTRKPAATKAAPAKKATIDHSKHGHAMTGSEGKKARAACRRAIAAAAKAKAAKTAK